MFYKSEDKIKIIYLEPLTREVYQYFTFGLSTLYLPSPLYSFSDVYTY